jgi:uncharacterized membrane protein YeaQ/YmgE (transglycosylase-associated protein family)
LEYFWFVAIGLAVGAVGGRFLHGDNFGMSGDVAFGVVGALVFGVGLGLTGFASGGLGGTAVVVAAIGAAAALVLRRRLRSV